ILVDWVEKPTDNQTSLHDSSYCSRLRRTSVRSSRLGNLLAIQGVEMQGTLVQKIIKTARHPRSTLLQHARAIRYAAFTRKEYVCTKANRSPSDNGLYIAAVQAAIQNYKAFSTFKRHRDYRGVLEHVTREEGQRYLNVLRKDAPDFIEDIEKFKVNDLVGGP